MKLLLDTHIFLWFISGDASLLGKLPLPQSPESYLPVQRERHQIVSLSLDEYAVAQLIHLPSIHRDPFDRILICQALKHDLTLVTVDTNIQRYPVPVLKQ